MRRGAGRAGKVQAGQGWAGRGVGRARQARCRRRLGLPAAPPAAFISALPRSGLPACPRRGSRSSAGAQRRAQAPPRVRKLLGWVRRAQRGERGKRLADRPSPAAAAICGGVCAAWGAAGGGFGSRDASPCLSFFPLGGLSGCKRAGEPGAIVGTLGTSRLLCLHVNTQWGLWG